MSSKRKQILSRLMNLGSEEADKQLKIIAQNYFADVSKSNNNDQLYEILELLNEFVYKVPEETIAIIRQVITGPQNDPPIHTTPLGDYEGKSHRDLIIKCIELLTRIRYISPREVLEISELLTRDEDADIKNKALEVIKKISQYDYNLLTKSKLGYAPQRTILDYIVAWPSEKSIENIEFVEAVTKELLSSSVEGTEMTDEKTLTIRFAAVDPTDFLKKIRRDTIDFIWGLYEHTDDSKIKLRLVNILDEVTSTPGNVEYGDNIIQMVKDDLNYLVGKYQKIVFSDSGDKIVADLGIVKEIEDRLYWVNKWGEENTKDADMLRDKILSNDLYKLFRLLIGKALVEQEEDWQVAEEARNQEIDSIITSIEESQDFAWFSKLSTIAQETNTVTDWEFEPFRVFIEKLSRQKPTVADNILELAFEQGSPLILFIRSFLNGFRVGNYFTQWDKFVDTIVEKQSSGLVKAIVYSLHLPPDSKPLESLSCELRNSTTPRLPGEHKPDPL